jgi:RNA polymerase sigma factor (sigma-70 family)
MDINEIVRAAQSGDSIAENRLFAWLRERFEHFVSHRIWNEASAQDVVQEALMAIAREYKTVEFQKSFAAWAYKLLNYRILQYIETKTRESARTEPLEFADTLANPRESDIDLRMQLADCLKKLHSFNSRHAEIIALHQEGFTTDEICSKLQMSPNALYISLSRARRLLERCLETGVIG